MSIKILAPSTCAFASVIELEVITFCSGLYGSDPVVGTSYLPLCSGRWVGGSRIDTPAS